MEVWKDVVGYEGLYQVSNFGNVKNLESGRILRQTKNAQGYLTKTLSKNGTKKQFYVHRLVALAFIPNPEGKPEVNHIDGDKANAHVDNLEWVTSSENRKHSYKNGLNKKSFGEKAPNAKLSDDDADFIIANCKKNGGKYSQSELARMFGVTRALVSAIVLGKTRSLQRT